MKIMNTQILKDIGLTNSEIKVYLALLELGSSTAGPILEKSGLHNSVVHITLHRLIEKGLVSFVKEGKRNHYQATSPSHISEYIEEKKKRFEELLPTLLLKQKRAKDKKEVTVFRGKKGIRELLYTLLDAGGSDHHTFGSSKLSLMMGEGWWVGYHENRAKRKIKAKLLFNESLASWKAEKKYPKTEVRYTKEGFEPLTETIIRNNTVGIILWIEKPIGILIENDILAASYDQFFSVLWDTAK